MGSCATHTRDIAAAGCSMSAKMNPMDLIIGRQSISTRNRERIINGQPRAFSTFSLKRAGGVPM